MSMLLCFYFTFGYKYCFFLKIQKLHGMIILSFVRKHYGLNMQMISQFRKGGNNFLSRKKGDLMNNPKSTLILRNGSIYTVHQDQPWAEAIVIQEGLIEYVGPDEGADPYINPDTQIIDLERKMVLPGFVDAHAHPSQGMDLVGNISLYAEASLDDYVQVISDFVKNHPERDFYRGSGWADTFFSNRGPGKEALDNILPDRPIALVSYDGHSMWVNSVTLKMANIIKDTLDPDGGRIERNPETGEPTGTLRETAFKLVEDVIPDYSLEERKNALVEYQKMAAKAGVTLVHDAMLDAESTAAFNELAREGNLKIRFRGSITLEADKELKAQVDYVLSEKGKNTHPYFQTLSGKIFVDGVIEGGTAYLLEPYAHQPDFRGEPIWDPKLLNEVCALLDKEKIQIHLHVIGDAAARITLDAIEHARNKNGKWDSRHSITHMHLVDQADIPRFKNLDIVGLPQPFWFKVDDYYDELALPYLGQERADRQYPMQSLIDSGVVMASSSDFPVTIPFDPLIAIQTGMTRNSIQETENRVLWPEERSSLEDLIRSFTYNGAYANFLEDEVGSLEVDKKADLIVLDQNLFDIPVDKIAKVKVLLTMVEGNIVYQGSEFPREFQ
ncbi:MAG: amidohydrolase [Chloroflexota bacterium]|nr:MAG: amidohydrolase [Chloroflexota bacterium]